MRYVLSWILEHIVNPPKIDSEFIKQLYTIISKKLVEVDEMIPLFLNQNDFFIIKAITLNDNNTCVGLIFNSTENITLPMHNNIMVGEYYLIIKNNFDKSYRFATFADFKSDKDGFLGSIEEKNISKEWKNAIPWDDAIIIIDNNGIGHRPDLFSHRGLAREIAALFDLTLIDEHALILLPDRYVLEKDPTKITIKTDKVSVAFTTEEIKQKESKSTLSDIFKLAKAGMRPLSFLIDKSNVVMLDLGNPMHVFDKDKIDFPLLFADNEEAAVELLDETTIKTDPNDIILKNNNKIIALPGVMGGKNTSLSFNSSSIMLEAGCFDAYIIRKTSQRHDKKTESALRFTKGMNPTSAFLAIKRFLFFIKDSLPATVKIFYDGVIDSKASAINIEYKLIDNVIGNSIDSHQQYIEDYLNRLGFIIQKNSTSYTMTIPWWRNDIKIAEDIIEEVVRGIGYDSLILSPLSLPLEIPLKNRYSIMIRKLLAQLCGINEVITYGIANNQIKKVIEYDDNSISFALKNSYSEDYTNLITSLFPGLYEIVKKKLQKQEAINDYRIGELAPVFIRENENIMEIIKLSLLFFRNNNTDQYDFYYYKNCIQQFFDALNIHVTYHKKTKNASYCSSIFVEIHSLNKAIGTMCFIDPIIVAKSLKTSGALFFVDINYESLCHCITHYEKQKISIIQKTVRSIDVSMWFNPNHAINDFIKNIKKEITVLHDVVVIDYLKNNSDDSSYSVTMRYYFDDIIIKSSDLELTIKKYIEHNDYKVR